MISRKLSGCRLINGLVVVVVSYQGSCLHKGRLLIPWKGHIDLDMIETLIDNIYIYIYISPCNTLDNFDPRTTLKSLMGSHTASIIRPSCQQAASCIYMSRPTLGF